MSQNNPLIGQIAALVIDLLAKQDYPEGCNAHIFPDGKFRSDDGRPARDTEGQVQDWRMDAEIAADLIAALEQSGKPILYDYEHNSLFGDSVAAGWITKLVYVAGRGLFAHVEWVDDAAEAIAKKKYRYSSPCFYYDASGRVTELISVALTNNPALGDLGAVALVRRAALSALPVGALAQHFLTAAGRIPGNPAGDPEMTPEQIAALTSERDTLKTSLASLTAERDKANADLAALRKKVDDDKAAAEAKEKADLLAAATSGDKPKMTPAQAEAVKEMPLAALKNLIGTLGTVALTNLQSDRPDQGGVNGLTADEVAACSRMNVTPEEYLAAKKR
ncbi:phage protease [Azonexus sp.]|uniref:phage protease n=1 Tax=Azonexus sp. TaxID=1872668 RepID=UPI0027BAF722|nr:phage protease [Azonexus sp.]